MTIPKTYFSVEPDEENNNFRLVQRYRTAYYEDVVNPNGYRDAHTATCDTKDEADHLVTIFNKYPLTSEFLNKHAIPNIHIDSKGELILDHSRYYGRRNHYPLYLSSESKVTREEDLYNGTDQSMIFYQRIYESHNRFNELKLCRYHNYDYLHKVFNHYTKDTGKPIFQSSIKSRTKSLLI